MSQRDHSVAASISPTRVHRRPALDFSVTGVVYIAMMLFMGVAAINSQANLLFGVFGLMIGILLVSTLISRLVLRRLEVRRVLPEHACVGHATTLIYEITNRKRFWPSLSVVVAELDGVEAFTSQPQGYMLHAAPQMTASVPALVVPKRRGLDELNRYQLGTSFPFGFIKRAVTARHRDVLLVYPPLAEVDRKLLARCRSAERTGETMRPRPGGADEFYGVKEYRAGDNPRWIYWRRSARAGTLVSKEMTRVAPPRILLLVDTFLSPGAPGLSRHAAVEKCIAMAASLAAVALDQDLSVGLCVWSGQWLNTLPTRGKRHRDDLLSLLSRLPRNGEHDIEELLEQARPMLRAGTTPILFTPRKDLSSIEETRSGMIVIPADSPSAEAWFRFDAAIQFETCMPADQQPKSKGSGFRVGRVPPAEIPVAGNARPTARGPILNPEP